MLVTIVRLLRSAAVATALAVALVGCASGPPPTAGTASSTPAQTSPEAPTSSPPTTEPPGVVFVSVVDGDTIETTAGTVRLIGIDTPERGQCGDSEASDAISRLVVAGDPVTLELPPGQNAQDKYGRLIRYVGTPAGIDLGLMQLQAGNAVARYDSTDGYPAHPREHAYHAAQVASFEPDGSIVTTACKTAAPTAAPPAAPTKAPVTSDPWWTKYSSCSKLKKNTVGDPTGPFRRDDPAQADIYDWFESGTGNNGDGDDDGLACE